MDDAHLGGDSPTFPPTLRAREWSSEDRKRYPVFSGLMKYFPDAMYAVSRLSLEANEKHNPGQHLHWATEKSVDTLDCLCRHMLDGEWIHVAWRALENLQRQIEAGWEPEWTCPTSKTSESETGSPSQDQKPVDPGTASEDFLGYRCESLGLPRPSSLSQTHTATQEGLTVVESTGPSSLGST